jgi:hypothetical protein
MTFDELSRTLDAYCVVLPSIRDQQIYSINITSEGEIKFSLERDTIKIPIT